MDANYIGWDEQTIVKPLLALQDSGLVRILLFEQLIDEWRTIYDSTGYIYNAPDPTKVRTLESKPRKFCLKQNFPNPFNSVTAICYQLSATNFINLSIYDLLGRRVRTLVDKTEAAGNHSIVWDGRDESGQPVSSGVYFYKLMCKGNFEIGNNMLFLK